MKELEYGINILDKALLKQLEAIEASINGIAIFNETGEFTFLNTSYAKIFGYNGPEELIGKNWRDLYDKDELKELEKKVIPEFRKKGRWRGEISGKKLNGEKIHLDISVVRIESGDSICIARDITEQKKAEEELKKYKDHLEELVEEKTLELKKVNQKLSKEKEKLEKYLNIAGVIFVVIDSEQRVSLINKKGCEVLGYERDEIIGKNWFENFLPEKVRKDVKVVFEGLMKGEVEKYEYFENPIITKSGKERIIAWHNTYLTDEKGKIIGTLSSGEDITERKKIENALQIEKAYFEQLFENAPEGIALIDNNSNILRVNKQFTEMFGYKINEIAGKSIEELIVPEELREEGLALTKQTLKGNSVTCESVRKSKNGKLINVSILGTPIKIDQEQVAIYIIYRDITERKKSEKALKESEEKYRTLFNYIADPVFIIDRETHRFLDCNETALKVYGYSMDELVNITLKAIHPPEELELVEKNINKKITPYPYTHITKDGKSFPVEIHTEEIEYKGRKAWISIVRDITERKKAEEEIERKNRELELTLKKLKEVQEHLIQKEKLISIGTLAAGIAHEINNPAGYIKSNLNSIIRYSNKLLNVCKLIVENTNDDKIKKIMKENKVSYLLTANKEAAEESIEGVEKISDIVKNMQGFARSDLIGIGYHDINEAIISTVNVLWNELKYKVEVIQDLGKIPEIKCNIQRLNLAFMNILLNSIQAIKKKGKIFIKTYNDDKYVIIEIKDTGIGIPEENLDKITNAFFTTKMADKHIGLGLTTANKIITEHSGKLKINSQTGKGTTVKIYLPVDEKSFKEENFYY